MSLINLFTNQVVVSRLEIVSGSKTGYVSTITADVSIQRMADEKAVAVGGAIGKTFRLYTDIDIDIQKGDKLVDENGVEYRVLAVSIPATLGAFQHLEIVILRLD